MEGFHARVAGGAVEVVAVDTLAELTVPELEDAGLSVAEYPTVVVTTTMTMTMSVSIVVSKGPVTDDLLPGALFRDIQLVR